MTEFKATLDDYVAKGLLKSNRHKDLPLTIYCYSQKTVFNRLWDEITLQCRGLVVDDNDRIVIRCMPKFFNQGEPFWDWNLPDLTNSGFDSWAVEKKDGSLIQVVNDTEYGLVVTSKGSFHSTQVALAKEILVDKKTECIPAFSYHFELIHPKNRVVLDYKDEAELYYLGAVGTENNRRVLTPLEGFPEPEKISDTKQYLARKDVEGVILCIPKPGNEIHRVKIKTEEYIRLHRIITGFSEISVWEALRAGQSLEFENMPEEFDLWLQKTIIKIQIKRERLLKLVNLEYLHTENWSDKEIGLAANLEYKSLVFTFRKKSVEQLVDQIWKMVRPKGEADA